LRKISEFEWRIPQHFHPQMRAAVRVFATRRLLEAALGDKSIEQAVNAAMLPGLVGDVLVMPDVHQGYGFQSAGWLPRATRRGSFHRAASVMISIAVCA
jgi:tRNA-splicing ligase RtcB